MPVDFPTQLGMKVKNTSGVRRFYGYLSVHGKWLDDDETFVEPCDLSAKFSDPSSRSNYAQQQITYDLTHDAAGHAATLDDGDAILTILQTARAIDQGADGIPKAVSVKNADSTFEVESLDLST